MNGVSPFVLNACAMPLAQLCHRIGTAVPSPWHKRAKGLA